VAEVRSAISLGDIRKVVQQIVERFRPEKIILFGSYAYGTPTRDSDVDLMVVMDTRENPLRMAGLISAAIDHPFPLDILVMSPSDLEEYLRERAVFPTQVVTRGLVLHEARDNRVD